MSYDDWKTTEPARYEEPELPEELAILKSAIDYLQARADADSDEQVTGEYEASCILWNAYQNIERMYEAHNEPPWDTWEEYRGLR